MIKLTLLSIILALALPLSLKSQQNTSHETAVALALRQNVISIKAGEQNGFGLIIGEKEDRLFVVTADHIAEGQNDIRDGIEIKFFEDNKSYNGKFIKTSPKLDMILLDVPKPVNFRWKKFCLGTPKNGLNVSTVGIASKWDVPYGDALGSIQSRTFSDKFKLQFPFVQAGTSGGPIITEEGIIGIVIASDGNIVTVLNIEEIAKEIAKTKDNYFQLKKRPTSDFLTVDLDGNTYKTSLILPNKRWMMQNLSLEIEDSWCYNNDKEVCEKNGRLYFYESAVNGCMALGPGWRLPTDSEWQDQINKYSVNGWSGKHPRGDINEDGGREAFKKMTDPDQSNLNIRPVGIYWHGEKTTPSFLSAYFFDVPDYAVFHTFTKGNDVSKGIFYGFNFKQKRLYRSDGIYTLDRGHSVRCVK